MCRRAAGRCCFGIPVAVWGAGFYLTALGVAVLATQTPAGVIAAASSGCSTAMTGAGVLFSAYLTWLELFVIHAICMYCVASAVVVTLMFGLRRGARCGPDRGPDLTPA